MSKIGYPIFHFRAKVDICELGHERLLRRPWLRIFSLAPGHCTVLIFVTQISIPSSKSPILVDFGAHFDFDLPVIFDSGFVFSLR